jgi:ATP-binding cassette, subfamily B, bacterial CvaB/MchF/RaxB
MYLQDEATECGLACLAMIADFHGFQTDVRALRRRFPGSLRGVTMANLRRAAGELKLVARGLRVELTGLKDVARPCILHWDGNHFVVLKAIKRNRLVLHDPAVGVVNMPIEEASRHFTGIVLELTPSFEFRCVEQKETVTLTKLTGPIFGYRSAILTVLVLAIGLELLLILTPLLIQWLVDSVLVSGDYGVLTIVGGALCFSFFLQAFLTLARSWTTLSVSTKLRVQWYANVFGHLLRLPLTYFEQRFLGSIATKFDAISGIQRTLSSNFVEALLDGFAATLVLVFMFRYSLLLGSLVLLSLFLYVMVRFLAYGPIKQTTEEYYLKFGKQQTLLLETLRGIRPLRLFRREDQQSLRWMNTLVDATNSQLVGDKLSLVVRSAHVLIFGLQTVAVIWIGGLRVVSGGLTVGMFVAFLAFKEQFNTRVATLVDRLFELRLLSVQLDRLADIVLADPEAVGFLSGPRTLPPGALEIRDLSFRYGENDPWLFTHLELSVLPGECIAVTGPSGVGKSTLVKLIAGLLRPSTGEILVGGAASVADEPFSERDIHQVAFVMQDDTLFAGSILDNITFFHHSAESEHVVRCSQLACIHDDIMAMPMGYETLVGDMGAALSGGQRQRVLLARALYHNPAILILDEATSHLDNATEAKIAASLASLKVTRIILAHRFETVRIADRVLLCANGRLEPRTSVDNRPLERAMIDRLGSHG